MTQTELTHFIQKRVEDLKQELENAYADGNSLSDYIEGCIDAYEIVLLKMGVDIENSI